MEKPPQKKLTIVMNSDLYEMAQDKCYGQFGIGLSSLIKVFLKAFTSQRGVGFYIGDDDLCKLFSRWLYKQSWSKAEFRKEWRKRRIGTPVPGPRLKDIYNL
ncbi:hypothetical protein KBC97_03530 [Candidatus Gracilibacteria bacterium]|nr:hypothetical protein [Candidatus Gracilibacteria bacterium]